MRQGTSKLVGSDPEVVDLTRSQTVDIRFRARDNHVVGIVSNLVGVQLCTLEVVEDVILLES